MSAPTISVRRRAGEQAEALAPRYFSRPLGDDPEAAAVLRYYFEFKLGFKGGEIPDHVEELALPSVPELFRLYKHRELGTRPTGGWTKRHRGAAGKPKKPKL